jgi:hypothetical protein
MPYWITKNNTGSTKSPYEVKLTLTTQPSEEKEVLQWMHDTFGKSGYMMRLIHHDSFYAEIFFKYESDITSFMLRWGDHLT